VALWIGLYPKPVLDKMDKSVAFVMSRVQPVVARVEAAKGLTPPAVTPVTIAEPPADAAVPPHAAVPAGH